MTKDKFGNGQDVCKVCQAKCTDCKVLKIVIKHKASGEELAALRYFVPLCDQHRGDGCLDMDIGWEAAVVPIDQMKGP